jgi:hypothetical protein
MRMILPSPPHFGAVWGLVMITVYSPKTKNTKSLAVCFRLPACFFSSEVGEQTVFISGNLKMAAVAKRGGTHALAAFHHAVAKGDIEKVKDFVQVVPSASSLWPLFCVLACAPSVLIAATPRPNARAAWPLAEAHGC